MNDLLAMIWVEWRKAIRSRMPLGTALVSAFMPLGVAFAIFVSMNPEISARLGLISAKANLIAYSTTDWPAYMGFTGQILAAGGFFLFILVFSWVFGREFADGTLKDMLAVPVRRSNILLAKFFVAAIWCAMLTLLISIISLIMGVAIQLPGGSPAVLFQQSALVGITALLVIISVMPFALLASVGRGYLLPIGISVLVLMAANITVIIGWGDYFPWSVAGLYAQAKSPLLPVSYWIVILTGVSGMVATYQWWKHADQI